MLPCIQELVKKFEAQSPAQREEQCVQQGRRADSRERAWERCSQLTTGEEDLGSLAREPETENRSIQERKKIFNAQKLFKMQRYKGRTVAANTTRALESLQEQDLQEVSQPIQALQKALQTMLEPTQRDLQILRAHVEGSRSKEEDQAKRSFFEDHLAELEKKLGRTVEANTTRALESMQENVERSLIDVTLDADTAHPRLEISDDGKSVKDTGTIRKVPSKEKRFDSHIFVLAKEGYTSGRHYWEVDVGKRRSWVLGIARESVTRKGTVTLSPKNGFWVIGFANGREYWAHTEPWTCLSVSGKLPMIGIFLDISAKQLSFYNVQKKTALYTFTISDGSSQGGKFIPFFSTGPAAAKPGTEPLRVVQGFADDEEFTPHREGL